MREGRTWKRRIDGIRWLFLSFTWIQRALQVMVITPPPVTYAEDDLVERCLGGDEGAWEQIIARYRKRVLHLAYKFTGRYEEAEDLMQEIFLRVFRGLDRFDRDASFSTWLMSVARNHCIDHYRARKRAREVLSEDAADIQAAAATTGNPLRRIEDMDRRSLLRAALERLPDRLRQAVVLRDLMELSYEEIVARLGLPEGTVKSRLSRGRASLARQIRMMRHGERKDQPSARDTIMAARRRQVDGA